MLGTFLFATAGIGFIAAGSLRRRTFKVLADLCANIASKLRVSLLKIFFYFLSVLFGFLAKL